MHYPEFERRKYPRFNAEIPVNIGLIDLKGEKRAQAQFKAITKDISMEGLGLELDYPASDILSFAPKLIGANKEFDLDLNKNLGTKHISGIGEVRWVRIHPPSVLTMGLFLKEMTEGEKEKWTNLVTNQKRAASKDLSCRQTHAKHSLTKSLHRSAQNLILSRFSKNGVLPALFMGISVIIYWFVEITFYHLLIPLGIAIIVVLLTKSRIFSRKYPRSGIGT